MAESPYNLNRYKLLQMVAVLHKRGYEKLRVVPSVAPSGMSWRCVFVWRKNPEHDESFIASGWLAEVETMGEEIKQSPEELADLFEQENPEFLNRIKGENPEYVGWYKNMINRLDYGEIPYAFGDYFQPQGFWRTTKDKQIKISPGEEEYYNY